jgi:hypothetical protein
MMKQFYRDKLKNGGVYRSKSNDWMMLCRSLHLLVLGAIVLAVGYPFAVYYSKGSAGIPYLESVVGDDGNGFLRERRLN